jgi:hypothetical protein
MDDAAPAVNGAVAATEPAKVRSRPVERRRLDKVTRAARRRRCRALRPSCATCARSTVQTSRSSSLTRARAGRRPDRRRAAQLGRRLPRRAELPGRLHERASASCSPGLILKSLTRDAQIALEQTEELIGGAVRNNYGDVRATVSLPVASALTPFEGLHSRQQRCARSDSPASRTESIAERRRIVLYITRVS